MPHSLEYMFFLWNQPLQRGKSMFSSYPGFHKFKSTFCVFDPTCIHAMWVFDGSFTVIHQNEVGIWKSAFNCLTHSLILRQLAWHLVRQKVRVCLQSLNDARTRVFFGTKVPQRICTICPTCIDYDTDTF